MAAEPVAADTTAAAADESPSSSSLERGHQLLAEDRYDEAIKEFKAAHQLKPSVETHVGLATALLRGRRVLQPGDMCDPSRFRDELEAHRRVEEIIFNIRFLDARFYEPDRVENRQQEIAEAIKHLEAAAKIEPDNVSVHEEIVSAKIALFQFEEEAHLRSTMGDINFATESDFGKLTRMDSFELPSLKVFSGGMYSLNAEP